MNRTIRGSSALFNNNLLLSGRIPAFILLLLLTFFFTSGCTTSKLGKAGQRKVEGRTYVIVGASSGFGRGVAEQLGEYNANVVVAARRTELLEEVAANVREGGGTALAVTTDISKPEDVQRLADTAVAHYGHVDVWINMSGVGAIGRFWEIPIEDQAALVDINLKGFIYGSHAAMQQFTDQGHGILINMGSIESAAPLAYHASYAATKAGILNLTAALNQELRLSGYDNIRVVNVEPWAADTPFWKHAANYSGRNPRMAAMDPPEKIVNAVIRSSLRPRTEVPVGWKATASWLSYRLFPRLTERLSANLIHKSQIEEGLPASPTSGAVHEAMEAGREVDGGVRERMEREEEMTEDN